ncbi:spermidine synthase [Actinotalea ferrariae CF5-4]|uniref:Spermidine synthase n=1 Tax=Actinotalea ferrariae CF5-4 TaxID=948458 RepID=A0A021VTY0_9CELL|nr:spermidine synthase [Actinotalea ferrariae]EYR63495.1 spermidine synthase [Actinotalea ferrariae CF5-4]
MTRPATDGPADGGARRPRFEELGWERTAIGDISLRRRVDPGTGEDVYEVKLDDAYLMSSLFTAGEVELSRLALAHAPDRGGLRVVVGGLGLGFTAATVLDDPRVGELVVVDALRPVIGWHEAGLVPLGRRIAGDPRCRLVEGDFFALAAGDGWADGGRADAVVVDIDHSPRHVLAPANAAFYTAAGTRRLRDHLAPGGVFALWSDDPPDEEYLATLRTAFDDVVAHTVEVPGAVAGLRSANTVYVAVAPA